MIDGKLLRRSAEHKTEEEKLGIFCQSQNSGPGSGLPLPWKEKCVNFQIKLEGGWIARLIG